MEHKTLRAVASGGTPATSNTQIQSSRYDIAGVTPDQYERTIANAILGWQTAGYLNASPWWNPLIYSFPITQNLATVPQYWATSSPPYAVPYYQVPAQVPNSSPLYYTPLAPRGIKSFIPANVSNADKPYDPGQWLNRPQCNPLIQSPLSAAALAEMAPYFLQHCSQFIVEYAGDYLQQDINGNMTGLGPDGQIDFYLDANGNKHIRWYGMPRSSTGVPHLDGPGSSNLVLIRGFDAAANETMKIGATPTAVLLNYFTDVIPLRDYYSLWFSTQDATTPIAGYRAGSYSPPWEVDVNFDCTHDYGAYFNTAAGKVNFPPVNTGPNQNAFNTPTNPPRYVAAWHDDMPAMIRILIKVDDPNNKIKDGPWYEYVFRLK